MPTPNEVCSCSYLVDGSPGSDDIQPPVGGLYSGPRELEDPGRGGQDRDQDSRTRSKILAKVWLRASANLFTHLSLAHTYAHSLSLSLSLSLTLLKTFPLCILYPLFHLVITEYVCASAGPLVTWSLCLSHSWLTRTHARTPIHISVNVVVQISLRKFNTSVCSCY